MYKRQGKTEHGKVSIDIGIVACFWAVTCLSNRRWCIRRVGILWCGWDLSLIHIYDNADKNCERLRREIDFTEGQTFEIVPLEQDVYKRQ